MSIVRRSGQRKGIVVKPMVFSHVNSREQINLDRYTFMSWSQLQVYMLLSYHFTKFVLLKALTSKRTEAVAFTLLDMYTIFGIPCVLQSDNGREFRNWRSTVFSQCVWNAGPRTYNPKIVSRGRTGT